MNEGAKKTEIKMLPAERDKEYSLPNTIEFDNNEKKTKKTKKNKFIKRKCSSFIHRIE